MNYEFKYQDRTIINSFLTGINDVSDILIIKNGLLTDTSFSNIILFDGEKWITPDTYLLNGVKRRRLLENNEIIEKKGFYLRPKPLSKNIPDKRNARTGRYYDRYLQRSILIYLFK